MDMRRSNGEGRGRGKGELERRALAGLEDIGGDGVHRATGRSSSYPRSTQSREEEGRALRDWASSMAPARLPAKCGRRCGSGWAVRVSYSSERLSTICAHGLMAATPPHPIPSHLHPTPAAAQYRYCNCNRLVTSMAGYAHQPNGSRGHFHFQLLAPAVSQSSFGNLSQRTAFLVYKRKATMRYQVLETSPACFHSGAAKIP
ncbi:hypothetical protein BDZ91DRAFT_758444 [Kalaharituber pfeilii]|nr:hypothetical protein BDZ91DRAFT_758444 [Kalaharituber pfeilii]